MRFAWILALLLAVADSASATAPDTQRSGAWTFYSGETNAGRRVCGIQATNGASGDAFYIKHFAGTQYLAVQVFQDRWDIPHNTRVRFEYVIDGQYLYHGQAFGTRNAIEWRIGAETIESFVAQFMAGHSLTLRFPDGTGPPLTFSLIGSSRIFASFAQCMRVHTGLSAAAPT